MNTLEYVNQYKDGDVQPSIGVTYKLRTIIEENQRMFAGQPKNKTDEIGRPIHYINMPWIMYRTLFQGSDVDTKDINLRAVEDDMIPLTPLVRAALRTKLQYDNFGEFIDRVRSELIAHGHVIVKMCQDGKKVVPRIVNLINVVRLPSEQDLQKSGIIEKVVYTHAKLRDMKMDKEVRETVDKIMEKEENVGRYTSIVYEDWRERKIKGDYHKSCTISISTEQLEERVYREIGCEQLVQIDEFITPWKEETEEGMEEVFPYYEQRFFSKEGRWLGIGVFELLADLQKIYNTKWNAQLRLDMLASKGIYVHKFDPSGETIEQKYLQNIQYGGVLPIKNTESMEQLRINTMINEMLASTDKIFELARQMCGVSDLATGQVMPSGTTATTAQINAASQQTTYDYLIELIHHLLNKMFNGIYGDAVIKGMLNKRSLIIEDGDELEAVDFYLVDKAVEADAQKAMNGGIFVTEADKATLKEQKLKEVRKKGKQRFVTFTKDLLSKKKMLFDWFVNNETFDKQARITNINQVVSSPLYTGDRNALYNELLDIIGVPVSKLDEKKNMVAAMQPPQAQQMPQMSGIQPVM